jgi:hypothetical protein
VTSTKDFPSFVAQHHIRDQSGIARATRPQIYIQVSVVIDVPEIRAHGQESLIQFGFPGDILESAIATVMEQAQGGRVVRKVQVGARRLLHRGKEARHEHVGPTVVVVVEEPGGEAAVGIDSRLPRDLAESAVVAVVLKISGAVHVGNEEIHAIARGRPVRRAVASAQGLLCRLQLRLYEIAQLLRGNFVPFEVSSQLPLAADRHGVQRVRQTPFTRAEIYSEVLILREPDGCRPAPLMRIDYSVSIIAKPAFAHLD